MNTPGTFSPSPPTVFTGALQSCGAGAANALDQASVQILIGQIGTVGGDVVNALYRSDVNAQPTFLDFHYPYQGYFRAVIFGSDRGNFPQPPENMYRGQHVCVHGKVEEYAGAPEIKVHGPEAITIAGSQSPVIVPTPSVPVDSYPCPTDDLSAEVTNLDGGGGSWDISGSVTNNSSVTVANVTVDYTAQFDDGSTQDGQATVDGPFAPGESQDWSGSFDYATRANGDDAGSTADVSDCDLA